MTIDHAGTKDHTGFMWLMAVIVIALLAGSIAFMGLGGLILFGVGATWLILALLVFMTAGD